MAIRNRYYTGSSVSRHLPPGDRAWTGMIVQSGLPVTDADFNLDGDIQAEIRQMFLRETLPSGWLRGQTRHASDDDYTFPEPSDLTFVEDAFYMRARTAVVAGLPVWVEYTGTSIAGQNLIQLDSAPELGGTAPDVKRADFVFLEVWQALVAYSPHASGTVTVEPALPAPGDTIVIGGVVLTAVAAAPGVDEFLIGADEATTAANIASAITDPTNSFDTIVTATADGVDIVTLVTVVAGSAGNAVTLTVTGTGLTPSGALLTGGLDMPNKPAQDEVYRHGNTDADASVNLSDDIADPVIGVGLTQRVQTQYRIRVTGQVEAVNYKTQPDGFSNTSILAQGAESAPVVGYPFVRADKTTVSSSSSAVAYGIEDSGLWVAGDGSSAAATALGTVDGYVYAIPIAFVHRRNDAYLSGAGVGFDPLNNTNGAAPTTHAGFVNPAVGVVPAGTSDRPDGLFSDAIVSDDVVSLRRHVSLAGFDWASELRYQEMSLLDGKNHTWAVDAADKNVLGSGSGDVSTRFLVCDQFGRSTSKGGVAPTSGSTTRGATVRDFDHVARRFGTAPVVERIVFSLLPTDTSVGTPGKYVIQANALYTGWAEGDEVHLDFTEINATTLGDFDPAGSSFTGTGAYPNNASIFSFVPAGTTITNVLSIYHDDGHYTTAVDQSVQATLIEGIGTSHVVITLDANDTLVNAGLPDPTYRMVGDSGTDDGSPRRIFVEVEITYPAGAGLTETPLGDCTPDATVYTTGPILENSTAQRPTDFESLTAPAFRSGFREAKVEYVANEPGSGIGSGTPVTDTIISRSSTELVFHRRVFGSALHVVGVTDDAIAQPHNVNSGSTEYGSSSRLVVLDTSGGATGSPLSGAGQTQCTVTYMAQDPVPNYGASGGGYQVGVYYRALVKPTVGVMSGALTTLPDPLVVEPLATSPSVWSVQTGKGSPELPYPYENPSDYIAVNDGGTATYTGEWYFSATASVSVSDFDAQVGIVNLHGLVQVDGTGTLSFEGKDKDAEFRAFYDTITTDTYRPTAMAQPLSSVARHKVFTTMLVRATEDCALFRKNEVLLVVVSRFAELDADNRVIFSDTDNRTAAAVYKTRNLLLIAGD